MSDNPRLDGKPQMRIRRTKHATRADVPAVPVRDIALGGIQLAERHMLAWFYLYLVVKTVQDSGAKT